MANKARLEAIKQAQEQAKMFDNNASTRKSGIDSPRRSATSASAIEGLKVRNEKLEQQIQELSLKSVQQISTNLIQVTKYANRSDSFLQTKEFYDLLDSIRKTGQSIPIQVRACGNGYELISGRRRLEACRKLGIDANAIVLKATDQELLELQLIENSREDLTYFDEGKSILEYREALIESGDFVSDAELAKTIGVSKAKVSRLLAVAKIPSWIRDNFLRISKSKGFVETPEGSIEVFEEQYAPMSRSAKIWSICEGIGSKALAKTKDKFDKNTPLQEKVKNAKNVNSKIALLENLLTGKGKAKNNRHIIKEFKDEDRVIGTLEASDKELFLKFKIQGMSSEQIECIESEIIKILDK